MKIQFHNSGGESHNFWQNYTDIMSGLMIVFLLASLGYIVTHDEEQQIKAINEAYKELSDSSKYFKYSEKYNLFECLVDVRFRPLREYSRAGLREASRIPREKIDSLVAAGRELKNFISKQEEKHSWIDFEIVIDGRVAMENNPELSYLRAYSLYKLWEEVQLFNNTDDYIHAAGSSNQGMGMRNDSSDRTFKIIVIPFIKLSKK